MSGVELPVVGTRIGPCAGCETPLPLCEAADPEDLRVWLCGRCGAEYRAILAPEYSIAELRNVRPEPVVFDQQSIQRVDPELLTFAQQLGAADNNCVEKRSSQRHAVVAVLTAQEFDERLHPVGPPFQTICRNLSAGGVCLVNSRAIQSDLLVIELSAAGGVLIQTLAQILRRQPLDRYFDIGIAFVTKLAARVQTS